jgi:hypothetical protein
VPHYLDFALHVLLLANAAAGGRGAFVDRVHDTLLSTINQVNILFIDHVGWIRRSGHAVEELLGGLHPTNNGIRSHVACGMGSFTLPRCRLQGPRPPH